MVFNKYVMEARFVTFKRMEKFAFAFKRCLQEESFVMIYMTSLYFNKDYRHLFKTLFQFQTFNIKYDTHTQTHMTEHMTCHWFHVCGILHKLKILPYFNIFFIYSWDATCNFNVINDVEAKFPSALFHFTSLSHCCASLLFVMVGGCFILNHVFLLPYFHRKRD